MIPNHLWLPYTQMQTALPPKVVKSTQGCQINLSDGTTLIDGMSSWWTACHGYNPPTILEAMALQAQKMPHVMLGGLTHEPVIHLSKKLSELLPANLNHTFFSESGSVAVEVGLKMILQYWKNLGYSERHQFVHFEHAYHGDTFYAMSVCCPKEGMHRLFNGQLPKQQLQPIPRNKAQLKAYDAFLAKHQSTLAGVIIEPLIQGAGGMKCHSPQILNEITRLSQKYELPVLFDEIFTGFGRTGTLFALEQIEAVPDIITLGKGLTGGVTPLAATVASTHIFEQFLSEDPDKALMHGPTFMGHALGCSAALASIKLFEDEPRLSQVASIESFLSEALGCFIAHPKVKQIRVVGAMGVIELSSHLSSSTLNELKDFYISQGAWIRPFSNIIYLAPSFNISEHELSHLTKCIGASLKFI